MARRVAAISALLAVCVAVVAIVHEHRRRAAGDRPPVGTVEERAGPRPPARAERPQRPARRRHPRVVWRRSTALGSHTAGRLEGAVRLPAEGEHFTTWDPVRKRSPNRWWRRNATDGLIRVLLDVTADYARAHPRAPRVVIGDLSRPRGGDFGRRFGPLGHVSHQNGLDADVYLPRTDRRLLAARRIGQVDRRLAQDLLDRFVRAGASRVFVGAGLRLRGPRGVVQPWPNHDDHLHVRFASLPRR
jgi:penicillin-insensitive murein endopeptidase